MKPFKTWLREGAIGDDTSKIDKEQEEKQANLEKSLFDSARFKIDMSSLMNDIIISMQAGELDEAKKLTDLYKDMANKYLDQCQKANNLKEISAILRLIDELNQVVKELGGGVPEPEFEEEVVEEKPAPAKPQPKEEPKPEPKEKEEDE